MPSDIEMTWAPWSTAHWMALTISSLAPPFAPRTLPMKALVTPGATPMRVFCTSRPKIVPAQCVPWPCWSPLPSPVKSRSTMVTPANAACAASMPVSRTATAMPAPVKGEVSALTALTPQVAVAAAGVAVTSRASPIGAIRRIGIDGATARTPLLRSTSRASRGSSSSIWYSMRGIGAGAAPAGPGAGRPGRSCADG